MLTKTRNSVKPGFERVKRGFEGVKRGFEDAETEITAINEQRVSPHGETRCK